MQAKTILVVDDEFSVRESLEKVLSKAGYITLAADSGNEALAVLSKHKVDLVLSDLKMPEGDGVELLKSIKKNYPDVEVILLTGYGTVENAVEAMREGAYDFITKPPKKAIILTAVERAIERQNLAMENKYLREQLSKGAPLDEVVGRSPAFTKILEMVNRVAPLVSTVLITGESGTGKELIARAIHRQSPRANNKFIPVNCAAIPENLVESELFGYMKGAFTGATRDKVGLFKVAEGGTIFLDEIVSVPLSLQVKLLRAIEQKEIMPVGGTKAEILDVRIVAATNKNLAEEVEKGYFRTDLYYRLNVIDILIPPLRERVDDIPELVGHFMKVYNVQLNKKISHVDPAIINVFKSYEWKGNVRELENVIERAMIMCDGDTLRLEHFAQFYSQQNAAEELHSGLKGAVRKFERDTILKSLDMVGHDKSKAAGMLGMSLSSLYRKMAELGIVSKE
jgi:DNA-binding NtrC family response regulator